MHAPSLRRDAAGSISGGNGVTPSPAGSVAVSTTLTASTPAPQPTVNAGTVTDSATSVSAAQASTETPPLRHPSPPAYFSRRGPLVDPLANAPVQFGPRRQPFTCEFCYKRWGRRAGLLEHMKSCYFPEYCRMRKKPYTRRWRNGSPYWSEDETL